MPLLGLPEEVLLSGVLARLCPTDLGAARATCGTLRRVGGDPSLWRRRTLHLRDAARVAALAAEGQPFPVFAIRLDSAEATSSPSLPDALAACPGLLRLSFDECYELTDADAAAALDTCPALTSVHFHRCYALTDAAPSALAACRSLVDVAFTACRLSDEGVAAVAVACPQLRRGKFYGCRSLRDAPRILHAACPDLDSGGRLLWLQLPGADPRRGELSGKDPHRGLRVSSLPPQFLLAVARPSPPPLPVGSRPGRCGLRPPPASAAPRTRSSRPAPWAAPRRRP